MKGFWLLWGFDALIALVFLVFFVTGLADGSVSFFNGGLWLLILLALGGIVLGSLWLHTVGQPRAAQGLLWLLALPGLACLLLFLGVLFMQPRWN